MCLRNLVISITLVSFVLVAAKPPINDQDPLYLFFYTDLCGASLQYAVDTISEDGKSLAIRVYKSDLTSKTKLGYVKGYYIDNCFTGFQFVKGHKLRGVSWRKYGYYFYPDSLDKIYNFEEGGQLVISYDPYFKLKEVDYSLKGSRITLDIGEDNVIKKLNISVIARINNLSKKLELEPKDSLLNNQGDIIRFCNMLSVDDFKSEQLSTVGNRAVKEFLKSFNSDIANCNVFLLPENQIMDIKTFFERIKNDEKNIVFGS